MSATRARGEGSARARSQTGASACEGCLRRSWLLGELGAVLDCNCRADGRLFDLLELGDAELIQALGGRRRRELAELHAAFSSRQLPSGEGVAAICRHDARYPLALRREGAPPALFLAGGPESLRELAQRPIVAFVGGARASDYGVEVAASLARGLAASGVTVASGLSARSRRRRRPARTRSAALRSRSSRAASTAGCRCGGARCCAASRVPAAFSASCRAVCHGGVGRRRAPSASSCRWRL